eukprot:360018-Chlamydomonas_euryale.AAC.3
MCWLGGCWRLIASRTPATWARCCARRWRLGGTARCCCPGKGGGAANPWLMVGHLRVYVWGTGCDSPSAWVRPPPSCR